MRRLMIWLCGTGLALCLISLSVLAIVPAQHPEMAVLLLSACGLLNVFGLVVVVGGTRD
jgi:hypothetical protein